MARFVRWAIVAAVTQTVLIASIAWLLPGFEVGGLASAFLAAVAISLALAIAWPFIYRLSARLHPLLFPVLTFLLTGMSIYLAGQIGIDEVKVSSVGTGILISLGLTIGNVVLGALFSLGDATGYDWFVIRPLRRAFAATPRSNTPGLLFLELDGLAEPILRRAIADGYMPTLARWLADGSHRLVPWETDLSSQTSASQAGILLGDNSDIPAFRWYDKDAGKLMVTSKLKTVGELERRLSSGNGLLADGGASRWNIFSGDAPDCLFTYSAVGNRQRIVSRRYVALFLNPYSLARTLALLAGEIVRERYQAWRQVRRDETPRIHRSFKDAVVRAGITTAMQEASVFMVISDMYRGLPAVYTTFYAYDEVAHLAGIDRTDAFKVLRTLDRACHTLERAAAEAPRPYEFVVLADHGQSMGATFKQRFGQSLTDLVQTLIPGQQRIASAEMTVEAWGHVNLALSEAIRQDGRTARLLQRAIRGHTRDNEVTFGPSLAHVGQDDASTGSTAVDVVVLASGNLGLISFPGWKDRLTYEALVEHFPVLIPGLVRHEGIGFVLVHSENDGGIVIGAEGVHYLDHGYAVGTDPLAPFGPNAARHLKRTDGFRNAPDILVNSSYDAATGEVAAFEELVGSHGGLGGAQVEPFVLFPSTFAPPDQPIIGAEALSAVLIGWRDAVQGGAAAPSSESEEALGGTHRSGAPTSPRPQSRER